MTKILIRFLIQKLNIFFFITKKYIDTCSNKKKTLLLFSIRESLSSKITIFLSPKILEIYFKSYVFICLFDLIVTPKIQIRMH